MFALQWLNLFMRNKTISIIGWFAWLAIGITIGVSQNSIILSISLGVVFGAALVHKQMAYVNFSSEVK